MRGGKYQKFPTMNRVIVVTLAAVTVIFALMVAYVLNYLSAKSIDRTTDEDVIEANQMALVLCDNFDYMSRLLHLTQQSFTEIDFRSVVDSTSSSVDSILKFILNFNPDIRCAWCIFEKGVYYEDGLYISEYVQQNGAIIESSSLNADEILEHPDGTLWYFEPLMTGETYFTPAELYKYSDGDEFVYVATISVPIMSNGEIIGVCGIDILYSNIIDPIYDLSKKYNRDIMLLNQDMTILYTSDDNLINKNLADFPFNDIENMRAAMERGETYSDELFSPTLNEEVFIYLQPISINIGKYQQSLYLRIDTPLSELNSETYSITFAVIIASCVSMLLIIVILYHNANRIIKPVKALARHAQQIASGDINADIFYPSDYDMRSKSEIVILRRAFSEMLRSLQENVRTIEKRVEERTTELYKLNKYVELLIESTSNISILTDQDFNILYCSKRYATLMCVDSLSEIVGNSLDAVHQRVSDDNYSNRCRRRMSRILSGEDGLIEDDAVNWPNGETRLYRIVYNQIKGNEDNFEGVIIIMRDLTDVRIEEAEHRLNDMLHSSTLACLVFDETGRIVAFNKESTHVFGLPENLSPEAFNNLYSSIEPEYQPDGNKTEAIRMELLQEASTQGFAQIITRLAKIDGTPIFININVARITWVTGYRLIAYLHDMTELMAKEVEAKEAHERIRLMLDATPLCCYFFDEESKLIECNQEALNLFGVTDKQIYLDNFYRFMPEYQPDGSVSDVKSKEYVEEAFKRGYTTFEWVHQKLDGEPIPSEVTLVRIKYGNGNIVLGYSRDLREVKNKEQQMREIAEREREAEIQKEAALAANEAKSQFLTNMSHEIRTPMNAVLGMSELLLHEKLSKRQLQYAKDIKIAATALLDIINDILDFSKMQTGKFNLTPVHYDFSMLIDNMNSIAQFMADNKGLEFRMIMQEYGSVCLYGDNVRLRQILLNLLSNAIKFTEKGYVALAVNLTDTTIQITVSDTGIGISADSIPTLFDAFERFDEDRFLDKTGTGLGLTITKAIVEMMDGYITVESVYGQGSSFHVEIPKVLGNEAMIQRSDDKDIIIYAPDAKILVVDDNKTNLSVACGLLKLCGISAETAKSGKQAIKMIQQNQYDIVFMDHRMPEMSGIDTTKTIRDLGVNTPIIALTASAIEGAREKMLDAGMNDYLWKPINKIKLIQTLKKWIPAYKLLDSPSEVTTQNELEYSEHKEFWNRIEQIKELDFAVGLEQSGGKCNVYKKTLRLMVQEIEKSENNLPGFLSSDDLENFRIEVHGIKGALASIGAMQLSAKAYELETASDKMDSAFCASNLPGFIIMLNTFNSNLKNAFASIKKSNSAAEFPQELSPIFKRLTEAFSEIDLVLIDEEMGNLDALNLNDALEEEIEQIKDMVMMMDYNGAMEYMKKLLN